MTDVYVYYFIRSRGPAGEKILSQRPATLEAIKGKGEAVMESQIVCDYTEVDDNGFLIGGVGNQAHPTDELWAQIRSLERRAHSRDSEALKLNGNTHGQQKYMLSLESRELRSQAQSMKKQRIDLMVDEFRNRTNPQAFTQLTGSPTAGQFL
jgi:hypothetical protein